MITPDEAEILANAAATEYVKACGCATHEDIANVLMKLASMCGVGMAAVVGRDDAVQRLLGCANYVNQTQPMWPWKKEPIQ